MNEGLIPRRYAKALLKFAKEKSCAERVYSQMQTLARSFAGNSGLTDALKNPFVDDKAKRQLVLAAAGSDDMDSVLGDFVSLLMQNNRVGMTRDIAIAYQDLFRKANNIYPVEITSATEMDEAELKRLKQLIEKHLHGATAEYTLNVNSELIGGFVVNIGSERLDASLQNELKQLRLKLLSK